MLLDGVLFRQMRDNTMVGGRLFPRGPFLEAVVFFSCGKRSLARFFRRTLVLPLRRPSEVPRLFSPRYLASSYMETGFFLVRNLLVSALPSPICCPKSLPPLSPFRSSTSAENLAVCFPACAGSWFSPHTLIVLYIRVLRSPESSGPTTCFPQCFDLFHVSHASTTLSLG